MSKRLLRRPEVEHLTGLSCSSIYRLMAENRFPRPVPLSTQAVAWTEQSISQWIDERIALGERAPAAA